MLTSITALTMAALAAASPLARRAPPPTRIANGFNLVANVTGDKDFTPSINNWKVAEWHTGAGLGRAGLFPNFGRTFYENGTADDVKYRHASLVADAGLYPFGLQIDYSDPNAVLHAATLNIGSGSSNFMLSDDREPFSFVDPLEYSGVPNSFLACNETIPDLHRPDEYHITLNFLTGVYDGHYVLDVPDNCVTINLVPQCATLEDLPAGAMASHEFAQDVHCYDDVSSVVWSD